MYSRRFSNLLQTNVERINYLGRTSFASHRPCIFASKCVFEESTCHELPVRKGFVLSGDKIIHQVVGVNRGRTKALGWGGIKWAMINRHLKKKHEPDPWIHPWYLSDVWTVLFAIFHKKRKNTSHVCCSQFPSPTLSQIPCSLRHWVSVIPISWLLVVLLLRSSLSLLPPVRNRRPLVAAAAAAGIHSLFSSSHLPNQSFNNALLSSPVVVVSQLLTSLSSFSKP